MTRPEGGAHEALVAEGPPADLRAVRGREHDGGTGTALCREGPLDLTAVRFEDVLSTESLVKLELLVLGIDAADAEDDDLGSGCEAVGDGVVSREPGDRKGGAASASPRGPSSRAGPRSPGPPRS
jgi:hypothetical protein